MPRLLTLACALSLFACAATPASAPQPKAPVPRAAPTAQPDTTPSATVAEDRPIAKAPPPGARCFARGRPAAAKATPAASDRFCNALNAREVARMDAEVRKRYDTQFMAPHKLVVDFGCDVAAPRVDQVVVEDGSGHGGSLRIVRFQRHGDAFAVRVIASSHYYQPSLTVWSGTIPAARMDALIARARVQMLARPHLIALSQDDGTDSFGGASFSSNDFHLRLSLTDARGRTMDRVFTGYESSENQAERLPMEIASEPLIAVINALTPGAEAITDDDRRFFSERLILTMQGDKAAPGWWVAERYISMAATLGTIDVIPALVHAAEEPEGAGADRRRERVFDAVRAISGWDARTADDGTTRTPAEATRALAVECAD